MPMYIYSPPSYLNRPEICISIILFFRTIKFSYLQSPTSRKRSASALAYIIETSLDQFSSEKPLRGCVAATAGTADAEEQTFALATSVSSSHQKSLECVHNCDVYFEVTTKSTAKTSFRRELVLISSTFACTDALKTIRLPFLLLIYRLMFKRTTVPAQWVGAVFSVVFMQIEHVRNFMNSVGPALMLAAFSSLLSAVAGVYIEMVLKSGDELWRRQFHLYIGASLMSVVPFFISKYCYGKRTIDVIANHMLLTGLILLSVALSAVHGIATSLVIKKLDNIVRFQLGALIYVFTAVLNKTFFPDKFSLSGWYILSVVLALYSMFIIERKSFL
ncbi:UDP-galactose translocator 1-like isoform X2 [Varroa jacobsoni]|uniref:UDP-galactose translocator 1-like isoform X2 n=1 Tax=Varroa jacobsoni TaxID=62625 RepID=UPI000BF8C330|nr:UDP-galactose translocator 1-like isoform X2 [Varroa jacobsoni]